MKPKRLPVKPSSWVVAGPKGGVGKSTTAVNLGVAIAALQKRVLLVDTDPQGTLTHWLGVAPAGRELLDAIADGESLEPFVREAHGLGVIPTAPALAHLDRTVAGEVGSEALLREAIAPLLGDWDVVIIDTAPNTGLSLTMALVASRYVLAMVEASAEALRGFGVLVRTIARVHDRLNPELELGGIIVNRVDHTRVAAEVVESISTAYPKSLLGTVRESVRIREAPAHHLPLALYDPEGSAVADFSSAARRLLEIYS